MSPQIFTYSRWVSTCRHRQFTSCRWAAMLAYVYSEKKKRRWACYTCKVLRRSTLFDYNATSTSLDNFYRTRMRVMAASPWLPTRRRQTAPDIYRSAFATRYAAKIRSSIPGSLPTNCRHSVNFQPQRGTFGGDLQTSLSSTDSRSEWTCTV